MGLSDDTVLKLATLITGMVTTMFGAYISYQIMKWKTQAQMDAEMRLVEGKRSQSELRQLTEQTEVNADRTIDKIEEIRAVFAEAMDSQLRVTAAALRRVADFTHDATDIAIAEATEKAYRARMMVHAGGPPAVPPSEVPPEVRGGSDDPPAATGEGDPPSSPGPIGGPS